MTHKTWIWSNDQISPDTHVRFFKKFTCSGENVTLQISCDSIYELYVNGRPAGFGQYQDFPHDKTFETLDLTPYCQAGENVLSIHVWYFGAGFLSYYVGLPGLLYELSDSTGIIAQSDSTTLCHPTKDYTSGLKRQITDALGFSYQFDANGQEDYMTAEGYAPAVVVSGRPETLRPRPVKKLELLPYRSAELSDPENRIYDMGAETVGYLSFRFRTAKDVHFRVVFGEHLVTNAAGQPAVPRIMSDRDFSYEFIGNGEWVDFENYMRRVGCRYLQIESQQPVEIEKIGLIPVWYPIDALPYKASTPLRQKIYDVSLHTLRCCMFDHFEDCPWREQSLYTMDGRNEVLSAYAAFGNYDYTRASLDLLGANWREDGLLPLCAPADFDLTIPSFCLVYYLLIDEYTAGSGDLTLAHKLYDRLQNMLEVFLSRMENGLVPNFDADKSYWNFYAWTPHLTGHIGDGQEHYFDLPLNAFLSMALQSMARISDALNRAEDAGKYRSTANALNAAIHATFFDPQQGVYFDRIGHPERSVLANALAVLCGATPENCTANICRAIVNNELIPSTLSMKLYQYDALLQCDHEAYANWVLQDIDTTYKNMLDHGATSFWENSDYLTSHPDGSLCHGWSAIPLIYLRELDSAN